MQGLPSRATLTPPSMGMSCAGEALSAGMPSGGGGEPTMGRTRAGRSETPQGRRNGSSGGAPGGASGGGQRHSPYQKPATHGGEQRLPSSAERGPWEWNADEWLRRYKSVVGRDRQDTRRLLREVAEHNYLHRFCFGKIPRTSAVPYRLAHQNFKMMATNFARRAGRISISAVSTADAIRCFAQPGHRVCALNFANGEGPGGGYRFGAQAQEEDLCRRMPQLYTTLYKAQADGMFPFGPSTCRTSYYPERYCDVLYTKDLQLSRLSADEGFAVLPPETQVSCSIISAAAPNRGARELYDEDLMSKAVEAIFIVPQQQEAGQLNTLILGAWGCGAFGCDPADVSQLFVQALQRGLGTLYDEVHFAILNMGPADRNHAVFKETFLRNGIRCDDLKLGRNAGSADKYPPQQQQHMPLDVWPGNAGGHGRGHGSPTSAQMQHVHTAPPTATRGHASTGTSHANSGYGRPSAWSNASDRSMVPQAQQANYSQSHAGARGVAQPRWPNRSQSLRQSRF